MKFKLFIPILICTSLLCGCASSSSNSAESTTESTTNDINGEHYYLEYDSSDIDEACALAVEKYFYAIETQDYDLYEESMYPAYFDAMEELIQTNYSYGMDTVLGELYDQLEESAGTYLETDDTETEASFEITEIELSAGSEDDLNDNLDNYKTILGDDFSSDIEDKTMVDVYFSVVAKINGTDDEQYIVQDNEILAIEDNNQYYIFG